MDHLSSSRYRKSAITIKKAPILPWQNRDEHPWYHSNSIKQHRWALISLSFWTVNGAKPNDATRRLFPDPSVEQRTAPVFKSFSLKCVSFFTPLRASTFPARCEHCSKYFLHQWMWLLSVLLYQSRPCLSNWIFDFLIIPMDSANASDGSSRCFPSNPWKFFRSRIFCDALRGSQSFPDCSPWINPGGSKGCWDVTDCTGDISKKVEMSFFYFRSIPKSP